MAKKNLTRAQEIKKKKKRKKKAKTATIIGIVVIVLIIAVVAVWYFVFRNQSSQATVNVDGEEIVVESQAIGELEGTWKNGSNTYTFDSSGNGVFCMDSDPISFVYVAKDGRLYINFLETTFSDCEYTYTVSGDKLTMVAEDGTTGGTYEFTRVE